MRNLFLSLAFLLVGSFALANTSKHGAGGIAILKSVKIANITIENLDKDSFKYRKDECDGGFSYFIPFMEDQSLLTGSINSNLNEDGVYAEFTNDLSGTKQFKLYNLILNTEGFVSGTLSRDGSLFEVEFIGENLTVDYIQSIFHGINTSVVESLDCPPCVFFVAAATVVICRNAANGCSPCNGTLTVGACSCSCTPRN